MQDEFKDIVVEIQRHFRKFGIQLLQDDTGNTIEGIEKKKRGDPGDITFEILRLWLQGKGRQPVTWQTLVNCLQDANLHITADYIQSELDTGNVLNSTASVTYVYSNYQHLVSSHFLILVCHLSNDGFIKYERVLSLSDMYNICVSHDLSPHVFTFYLNYPEA